MTLKIADRVKETTTTTGAGAISLAGAITGFQAFSSVLSNGDTCYYALQTVDSTGAPTGAWEVGVGTYATSGDTLSRTLLASSTGALLNLAAGTTQVWIDVPAYALAGMTNAWVEQTGNYLASPNDRIAANTTAGAFVVTLPATPAPGAMVEVIDELQIFDINALTIAPNGNKIAGLAQNWVLDKAGAYLKLSWQGGTNGWIPSGGEVPYNGVQWNPADAVSAGFELAKNGRQVQGTYGPSSAWGSMRAMLRAARSTGKLYFEFTVDHQNTYCPMIGVGAASAILTNYVGYDANGWGLTLGTTAALYHNAVDTTQTPYAVGDVCGVAVDFTPSTGSIQFFKNNAANGSFTGLTLGTLYPMCSVVLTTYGSAGTICTKAQQCKYSPPSGYSYWDS